LATSKKLGDPVELLCGYHGGDPVLARFWWRIVHGLVHTAGIANGFSAKP
jgi:hypothetical protein